MSIRSDIINVVVSETANPDIDYREGSILGAMAEVISLEIQLEQGYRISFAERENALDELRKILKDKGFYR